MILNFSTGGACGPTARPGHKETAVVFADGHDIPTPGPRGKTTRRRSTRTVRGPEGRWIADMKDQAAFVGPPEPPLPLGVIGTVYVVTCDHPSGQRVTEYDVNAWWFGDDQLETARNKARSLPGGRLQRRDTIRYIPDAKRKPRERVEWTEM